MNRLTDQQIAQYLASKGRNGDSELLHVTKGELHAMKGIGAMIGKPITRNPQTGAHEAFNWKAMIPAVVGIGATVMSGGTLSPLAAGLISGAATTAATGSVKQGIMGGITGGMLSGVGAGASEMMGAGAGEAAAGAGAAGMTDAAAMGAADSAGVGLASGLGEGAATAGAGMGDAAAMGAADSAGVGVASGLNTGAGAGTISAGDGVGVGLSEPAGGAMTNAAAQDAAGSAAVGLPDTASSAAGADTAGIMNTPAAEQYGAEQGVGLSGDPADAAKGIATTNPDGSIASGANGANGNAGGKSMQEAFGGKYLKSRVLPGMLGGLSVYQNAVTKTPEQLKKEQDDADAEAKRKNAPSTNANVEKFSTRQFNSGNDPYYPLRGGEPRYFKSYAGGGLASLTGVSGRGMNGMSGLTGKPGSGGAPVAPDMQDMDSGTRKMVQSIRSRYRSKKAAIDDMQISGSYMDKLGMRDPHDPVLDMAFGFTALQGKKKDPADGMTPAYARGGYLKGHGDGMSDSIPASIGGHQPARLANNEYIVPADAVSHLGNGSSDAGAQQLDHMVSRVRAARTGRPVQAPAINPRKVMPV